MASDPETLTQLARLLAADLSASATRDQVQRAIDQGFDRLTDALVAEAASSDDVFDRASALEFLDSRISDLQAWLSAEQASRLRRALQGKIEAW